MISKSSDKGVLISTFLPITEPSSIDIGTIVDPESTDNSPFHSPITRIISLGNIVYSLSKASLIVATPPRYFGDFLRVRRAV